MENSGFIVMNGADNSDNQSHQENVNQQELSEEATRQLIDTQLCKAGWEADSKRLTYARGVVPEKGRNLAIAEWPTGLDETGKTGFADYVLFIGLKPIAIVEAKRNNIDVSAKLAESYRYSKSFDNKFLNQALQSHYHSHELHENIGLYEPSWPDSAGEHRFKVPFCYSTNGRDYRSTLKTKSGIWYRDVRDPGNMPKALPAWHSPKELMSILQHNPQRRNLWFADNPDMSDLGLRHYQQYAVQAVEKAIVDNQQAILLAMATGTGKTRTAIALMYRLLQSQRFKRILFLVDRTSLGKQALSAFDNTRIKGDTFNSIFGIQGLTDKFPEDSTKIHVATVQSLVNRLFHSDEPLPVASYDCIVVDEAHRGYVLDREQTEGETLLRDAKEYVSTYRRILDHFDAVKIALTATPAAHTQEIFGEPVYRYSYRSAVVDGYLTDYDPPIRIVTSRSEQGVYLAKGMEVERLTHLGELIEDTLEDEQQFEVDNFNRSIIVTGFNRAVCRELVKYIDPTTPQKTLVFCINNLHADMVVEELRSAFKENYPTLEHDAIIKITGSADKDPEKVHGLIVRFDKERLPNVVVTVDLLTTGVDIPAICNLVFMRKVASRVLYEQMKGRATRLCPEIGKTRFRIFDAVDIYRTLEDVDTMRPVVTRPQVSMHDLLQEISSPEAYLTQEADDRLFAEHSHEQLIVRLQRIIQQAKNYQDSEPEIKKQVERLDELCDAAAGALFAALPFHLRDAGPHESARILNAIPDFVERLEKLKKAINDQRKSPIFLDVDDSVVAVTHLYGQYETPGDFLDAFDELVRRSPNAQPALKAVINRPRDLTRKGLVELQEWFDSQHFEESALRSAWKETRNEDIAARLIGHIRRAAVGDALKPFEERVNHALERIKQSNSWSSEQRTWLDRLAAALTEKVVLDDDVYKIGNFQRRGGKPKLMQVFDGELDSLLDQFSDYIWEEQA